MVVGEIVHYRSKDGSCRAAIVIALAGDTVSLAVFGKDGLSFEHSVTKGLDLQSWHFPDHRLSSFPSEEQLERLAREALRKMSDGDLSTG